MPSHAVTNTMNDHDLALLADQLPDAVVVVNEEAIVLWANQTAERLMGVPRSEWIGASGLNLLHPDDVELAALSMSSVQDKQVGTPIELRISTAQGWTLVELVGAPLSDGRVLMTMRDLTQRRRWEIASDDTARFRSLVHNAASITMLLSADGTVTSVSAAITRQLGLDQEVVCGRPLAAILETEDRATLAIALHAAADSTATNPVTVEVRLIAADGDPIPFELTFVSLLDDPTVEGLVVTGHDITRLRAAQEALEQLATYDTLTGLFNRRVFDAVIEREWALAQGDGNDSYVCIADLDGFKQLNDEHGHAAGDEALREFGLILRNLARETDLVARIGGDEFAVIQARCGGELAAIGLEARIHEELARRSWPGGVKLGVTLGHQSLRKATSAADAVERADLAMLKTKHLR